RIDPSARAILVLRDLQGLEYEQIAEVLEVPIGTVKSRLFRARASLREQLDRDEGARPGGGGGGAGPPGPAPDTDGGS
ncbi:MAG: sigma factor-like helix-turn-helix DNA-binding protein, partial [Planctomycetota bacterium]